MHRLIVTKVKQRKSPFLTIITRKHGDKRPKGFSKNQESVNSLSSIDYEQIFITDPVGVGMFIANSGFQLAVPFIDGEYVFLLDDDDFITKQSMISHLRLIAFENNNPDVIFFRMTIKNGMNNDYYPTEHCWKAKKPMIAHIGGSCFVVKRSIYAQYIKNFAHARCGDFHFINSIMESGATSYWHDVKMCETGKVSRGAVEC